VGYKNILYPGWDTAISKVLKPEVPSHIGASKEEERGKSECDEEMGAGRVRQMVAVGWQALSPLLPSAVLHQLQRGVALPPCTLTDFKYSPSFFILPYICL
jgi:hypothetical protein